MYTHVHTLPPRDVNDEAGSLLSIIAHHGGSTFSKLCHPLAWLNAPDQLLVVTLGFLFRQSLYLRKLTFSSSQFFRLFLWGQLCLISDLEKDLFHY